MGTQGAPCPQHEDRRVPLSFPCSSGSRRGLRMEEDPALRCSSDRPHPPPLWGAVLPPPSCRIGGESALQSEMGAASGDSPGCGGRMDLGSPAAAPGERKCCGVAWSLPVVLYPCLSSLSGTPSSR